MDASGTSAGKLTLEQLKYAEALRAASNPIQQYGRLMETAYIQNNERGAASARKLQDEQQKLGRVMEQAHAENARRKADQDNGLAKSISGAVRHPLEAAANVVESAGTAGIVFSGVATAAVLAGKGILDAANSLGKYAQEQENLTAITGLTKGGQINSARWRNAFRRGLFEGAESY